MNPTVLARTDHPAESHEAAHDLVESGAHERMMAAALALVEQNPGMTANELDDIFRRTGGCDRTFGRVAKRLSDLKNKGRVYCGPARASAITGKKNATWFAGERPAE